MRDIENNRSKPPVDWEEVADSLSALNQLSEAMLAAAATADWLKFMALTVERIPFLETLTAAQSTVDSPNMDKSWLQTEESQAILATIRNEFKKVAKVNQEIFDTINNKKQDLVKQMNDAHQGMVFLKRYGSQINQERVISKVI